MNSQPSSSADSIGFTQLRNWIRFPPDIPDTCVIVGDERKPATVLDESFGRIGLMIEAADAANLHVGDQLTVLNYGFLTPGEVQWIRRNQETQKVCLGVRWTD